MAANSSGLETNQAGKLNAEDDGHFLITRIGLCSYTRFLIPPNFNAVSSETVVLPASSSVRPSSKPVSIQTVVPKITAIHLPPTCSMDISPSHSDGSLVSMDESMTTSDTVRSPEVGCS